MGNRKKIFKNALRRRKGHSRIKSIFCSCKGSGFWSKHSHVSKSSVTAVPRDLMLASNLCMTKYSRGIYKHIEGKHSQK